MSRSNYTASGSKKSTDENTEMKVIKRNGKTENVSFDKILRRLKKIGKDNNIKINFTALAIRIIDQLYNKIPTTKIDELTAEQCASMVSILPEYDTLALHIIVSNHHKNTNTLFSATMEELYQFRDFHGKHYPLLSDTFIETVRRHADELDGMCDYSRDYLLSYFGFKTLEKSYLMHINRRIVERPQHMWLRVAVGLHGDDMENVRKTYHLMSQKKFTHATPTLFNSGTPRPQLSSCFLLAMDEDSIDCIYDTITECAHISKWSGGIGVACSKIRAKGSIIRGTNGRSNGIVPMLRVFNSTCLYIDQCVLPETYIYTTDGPVQMQHCIAGQTQILNLTGKMETIEKVLEHSYEGEMIVINSDAFMDDFRVTPEHPICIVSNGGGDAEDKIGNIAYEWVEAKNLCPGDKIIYRMPLDVATEAVPTPPFDVTLSDAFVYGLLLADGGSMLNTDIYTQVSFYKKYDYINDFMKKYLENNCIEYEIIEEPYPVKEWTSLSFRWKKSVDLPFRYSDLYDNRGVKRIHPRWFKMPNDYLCEIMRGVLMSYGIVTLPFIMNDGGGELFFDNSSRELVEGIRYICLRMGILAGGYTLDTNDLENSEEKSDFINSAPTYVIKIPKTKKICELVLDDKYIVSSMSRCADENGIILASILEMKTENYSGTLYDLQMKNEHNYTTQYGIVHNGGGKRNGSFAIYLEPWHADVEDFLQMRKNQGDENLKARDLFYAIWMPDLFMRRVKENGQWTLMCPDECPGLCDVYGTEFEELYMRYEREHRGRKTVKARDLWFQILDAQMETGTPYIVYKDSVNHKSNQKNIGTIKSSNLCVAPETQILTDYGYKEIQTLWGEKVNVWNGEEFSEVEIAKTGENQELIEVHTDDGCVLNCTPYHKFYIQRGFARGSIETIQASELKIGDKLKKCSFPIINGDKEMLYPYTHGFFCGDGTYNPTTPSHAEPQNFEKYYVPLNHTIKDKIEWFSGYCDADGCISVNGTNKQLQVSSINKDFLMNVKLMLQTCGVNPKIMHEKRKSNSKFCGAVREGGEKLPDGRGGYAYFDTKPVYKLLVTSYDLFNLIKIGFSPKRLDISDIKSLNIEILRSSEQSVERSKIEAAPQNFEFVKIKKIVISGRRDDTYCFNEPLRHAGIFNGILTSQCSEITLFTSKEETAVCNLASIVLPSFVVAPSGETPAYFNYAELHEVAKTVTYNLNRVIDVNFYPNEKTRRSNMRHRPIGIGVQGLADVFMMMNLPFASDYAKVLNKNIFETIYHAAVESSMEIARKDGPYETFEGSPASQGIFQFDMWNATSTTATENTIETLQTEPRYDWDTLRGDVMRHGLRNSMLLAPMPTASTSQIMGYNECFEPITSNIYSRRTLAGEFIVANKYLMHDLIALGLWSEDVKNNIIANKGSVQQIVNIPAEIREKYKTVWELSMKSLIDMAADRGKYICQSQSLNLWIETPSYSNLTAMHFYAFEKGLKTGIYYLRRRAAHQAQQFTIAPQKAQLKEDEVCEMCSS